MFIFLVSSKTKQLLVVTIACIDRVFAYGSKYFTVRIERREISLPLTSHLLCKCVCVFVCERERERECVCVCVSACESRVVEHTQKTKTHLYYNEIPLFPLNMNSFY